MSLLNRPSDGLVSILVAFCKCLLEHKEMESEELLAFCAPPTVVENPGLAKSTLNTWVDLGLFSDGGTIRIQKAGDRKTLENEGVRKGLPAILRRIVMDPGNNPEKKFWEADENKASDFSLGAAWYLLQDPYSIKKGTHGYIERMGQQQFTDQDQLVFQNDTRWSGFKQWAVFLGFAWSTYSGVLIPDPSNAIRAELPAIFSNKKSLTQAQFFKKLAKNLPVVDGGQYREWVEGKLNERVKGPEAGQISPTLSLALRSLSIEGTIQFRHEADAGKGKSGKGGMFLLGQGWKPFGQPVTHIDSGEVAG